MSSEYDVAIVGAGLAGLSLAVRLAARPNPPRILIIDPRTSHERDRTWCSWSVHPHPFIGCVSHRWPEWAVGSGPESVVRRCDRFPYQRIPADKLYCTAKTLLAQAPSVTWALGQSVVALHESAGRVRVALSDGNSFAAGRVYDSRPPEIKTAEGWRQIFTGMEIRCPGARWNPEKVVLMDFRQANENGVRFFYILPLSADSFLVEDTWLCPAGKNPAFSEAGVLAYATERIGVSDWEILHRETGTIPMFALPKVTSGGRITAIGTRGGTVRSSSGYAFTCIQQEADALAAAYPHLPRGRARNIFLRTMDAIFIKAIDQHPERLPEYMRRLFHKVKSERLIRFMESCPTWLDCLAVMKALPLGPFLVAAASLRSPVKPARS